MNGFQLGGSAHHHDKPVPGCLGRMVNLFDLTSSAAGNRLLTNKPHCDGSPLSRSCSDVSWKSNPIGGGIEDKVMVSELRRSSSGNKSNGTPVKMLIAQEMSKDMESKQNSPNVVARLMGLDALPQQSSPDLDSERSPLKGYSQNSHSEIPTEYWQQEECLYDRNDNPDMQCQAQNENKDIFEIWQQPQRTNCLRDKSPKRGRYHESTNEKKMMLIRQKFAELKQLATDEKFRQTKEYRDAIEVLSSNNDLLLKCLNESNSSFLQNIYSGQSIPPPSEMNRITLLRPSKLMFNDKFPAPDNKGEQPRKRSPREGHANVWDNQRRGFPPTVSAWKLDDSSSQPTRIVVLKPTPGKMHGMRSMASSTPSSPRTLHHDNLFEELVDDESREAREVAKEITQHMRESLSGHRRDETLLSSVFSNGYTGDESSFNKSEGEFLVGNLSDSDLMSPPSRQSWDYVNKYGSPISTTSLSRASYSPESSVCREAKKRLSERWAMMSSNGFTQEQGYTRRSSSTLGEMLALFDAKKSEIIEEDNYAKELDNRGHISFVNSNSCGEATNDSPRGLSRSKSLPISSTVFDERVNVEASDLYACKAGCLKETENVRTTKSSFTGKVASLFFSRNKRSSKGKSNKAQTKDDTRLTCAEAPRSLSSPGRTCIDASSCVNTNGFEEVLSPNSPSRSILPDLNGKHTQGIPSEQGALAVPKTVTRGTIGENQDQPSPISVLESPYEEEDRATLGCSSSFNPEQNGKRIDFCLGKSNLIDKSPPIGSIARTLSWDDCCVETATSSSYPLKSPFISPRAEEDEGEWNFLVQSLLSAAGLTDEAQLSSSFARWHSPESPLDPLLKDKYIDLTTNEQPLHEAKRRQLRSNHKLVFDCVNAALLDMIGIGSTSVTSLWGRPCGSTRDTFVDSPKMSSLSSSSSLLADRVWSRMKEWFPGEWGEVGDSTSLVEMVVSKEVVGKGWADGMRIEIDMIGKEIERKLLEELVEYVVDWWTGRD